MIEKSIMQFALCYQLAVPIFETERSKISLKLSFLGLLVTVGVCAVPTTYFY